MLSGVQRRYDYVLLTVFSVCSAVFFFPAWLTDFLGAVYSEGRQCSGCHAAAPVVFLLFYPCFYFSPARGTDDRRRNSAGFFLTRRYVLPLNLVHIYGSRLRLFPTPVRAFFFQVVVIGLFFPPAATSITR